MKERKLIVLGAGASIGGDFYPSKNFLRNQRMPSGSRFFYDVFRQYDDDGNIKRHLNMLGLTYEGLNEFIKQAYKINENYFDPNEWKKINIEDVLTFITIGESMYSDKSNYQIAFKRLKENLIDFIVFHVSILSFDRRCKKLDKLFSLLGNEDSVYTYNWDLIAERSLIRCQTQQYQNYTDFLHNYRKLKANYSKGIFLKLHGSIDWGICNNRKCELNGGIQYFENYVQANSISEMPSKCNKCGGPIKIQVIPPTSNKVVIQQDQFIHKEWLIATNQLRKFDRIIFYGYSFPITDFYSEWLFRQVNFLIDGKGFTKIRIDVINPDMVKKTSQTYKRYTSLFRGHTLNSYFSIDEFFESEFGQTEK